MDKIVNFAKDVWLDGVGMVESHPHYALGTIVALSALVSLWLTVALIGTFAALSAFAR